MPSSRIFFTGDTRINCTSWPFLEPNSDISEIGVVVSFLFSAYLTFLLVVVRYLLSSQRSRPLPGQILRGSLLPRFLWLQNVELSQQLTRAVESTILTLSDLQLLTSLAILISGYAQLFRGISLYHWSTIVDLAWFSALTHLATLTSLRQFFRKRPIMATFRVFVMGLVLTLLSVAYVPTGYAWLPSGSSPWDLDDFEHPYKNAHVYYMSMPTRCLYSVSSKDAVLANYFSTIVPPGDVYAGASSGMFNVGLVSLSILFLIASYGVRVVRLYRPLSQAFNRCCRDAPIDFLEKRYQVAKDKIPPPKFKILYSIYKVLLLAALAIAEAFFEIGASVFWEVLCLSSALIWGTLRLAGLRRNTPLSDEASWGFGQILALALCIIPIFDFVRRFSEVKELSLPTNAVSGTDFGSQTGQVSPELQEIKKATRYRSLSFLIMGTMIEFGARTLFVFPAAEFAHWRSGISMIASGPDIGITLLAYVVIMAACLLVIFVYVASCLAFSFRRRNRQQPRQSSGDWHGITKTVRYKAL